MSRVFESDIVADFRDTSIAVMKQIRGAPQPSLHGIRDGGYAEIALELRAQMWNGKVERLAKI